MSQVYNPEADTMAEIERLELEVRDTRRRVEHARTEADRDRWLARDPTNAGEARYRP